MIYPIGEFVVNPHEGICGQIFLDNHKRIIYKYLNETDWIKQMNIFILDKDPILAA